MQVTVCASFLPGPSLSRFAVPPSAPALGDLLLEDLRRSTDSALHSNPNLPPDLWPYPWQRVRDILEELCHSTDNDKACWNQQCVWFSIYVPLSSSQGRPNPEETLSCLLKACPHASLPRPNLFPRCRPNIFPRCRPNLFPGCRPNMCLLHLMQPFQEILEEVRRSTDNDKARVDAAGARIEVSKPADRVGWQCGLTVLDDSVGWECGLAVWADNVGWQCGLAVRMTKQPLSRAILCRCQQTFFILPTSTHTSSLQLLRRRFQIHTHVVTAAITTAFPDPHTRRHCSYYDGFPDPHTRRCCSYYDGVSGSTHTSSLQLLRRLFQIHTHVVTAAVTTAFPDPHTRRCCSCHDGVSGRNDFPSSGAKSQSLQRAWSTLPQHSNPDTRIPTPDPLHAYTRTQ
eukprot:365218-Chlamydomonas_euryale.AAC.6